MHTHARTYVGTHTQTERNKQNKECQPRCNGVERGPVRKGSGDAGPVRRESENPDLGTGESGDAGPDGGEPGDAGPVLTRLKGVGQERHRRGKQARADSEAPAAPITSASISAILAKVLLIVASRGGL